MSLRRVGAIILLGVIVPIVACLILLVTTTDSASPDASGLSDPGALIRWGLPTARGIRDLAAALTIGSLVVAAVVLPPKGASRRPRLSLNGQRAVSLAAGAGAVWVWSGLATTVVTYGQLSGLSPFAPGGMQQLGYFLTSFDLGRSLLLSSTLAAAVSMIAMFTRSLTTVALLAILALLAIWPVAVTGHAAGSANHDIASTAQFAHVIAVGAWVGGLATMAILLRQSDPAFATWIRRYSTLAGWSFAIVALSGTASALIRVPALSDLDSPYGAVLAIKVIALLALGSAGAVQRRRIVARLERPGGTGTLFWRLAGLELVVMAIAMGSGVALSQTPPPSSRDALLSTAESLLGYPMPETLGAAQWFTQWRVDAFWAPLALLGAVVYVVWVGRLRRRGDRWSAGRTASWLLGCLMLIWSTSGAPGVYGGVLFSMHMVQHMTVATAVPTFLVLGGPVTLALRALPRRTDRSLGPREWLLHLVHSRVTGLLGHPLVAAGLFITGLVAFYYSTAFEASLRSHTAHVLMIGHFLATGYLFASVICGIDPGIKRPPHALRMLLLMVTFGFHAFFSISLMSSPVLAPDWFGSLGRDWGPSIERDQYVGASLGWGLGDYPLAILGAALIWSWVRDDHRTARRQDRAADRDGDLERAAYNDALRAMSERADRHPMR